MALTYHCDKISKSDFSNLILNLWRSEMQSFRAITKSNIMTQHTHQKFCQDFSYFPTHESMQLDIACPILTLEYNRIWLTTIKQRCYLRLSLKMTELLTDSEKNHVSIERAVISTKYTASCGSIALLTPHICCWVKCSYNSWSLIKQFNKMTSIGLQSLDKVINQVSWQACHDDGVLKPD